jgi:hypothetical protein
MAVTTTSAARRIELTLVGAADDTATEIEQLARYGARVGSVAGLSGIDDPVAAGIVIVGIDGGTATRCDKQGGEKKSCRVFHNCLQMRGFAAIISNVLNYLSFVNTEVKSSEIMVS